MKVRQGEQNLNQPQIDQEGEAESSPHGLEHIRNLIDNLNLPSPDRTDIAGVEGPEPGTTSQTAGFTTIYPAETGVDWTFTAQQPAVPYGDWLFRQFKYGTGVPPHD